MAQPRAMTLLRLGGGVVFVRWRKKGLRTKECRTKRIRGAQGKRRMSPNLVGTLFCRCHGGEGGNESARRGGGNREERKRKGALYVFGRARPTAGNSKDGMMERRACVEIRNLKSSGRCVSRCKDYLTRSPPAYFSCIRFSRSGTPRMDRSYRWMVPVSDARRWARPIFYDPRTRRG